MRSIENTPKNSNPAGRFILHYLPYWPLFILLMGVTAGGAWLYLQFTSPQYESTARILIRDEKKGTENAKEINELDPLSSNKVVENELEIIQSRTLITEAVNNLYLYAPVFRDGSFRNEAAYAISPIQVQAQDPAKLRPAKKITFTFDNGQVRLAGTAAYPVNQWVGTPYGVLKFIPNPVGTVRPVGDFYFSLEDPRQVVTSIEDRLKVSTGDKLSSILDLSLRDEVPERGRDILNQLMDVYSEAIVKNKNALAANTMAFVDDQLRGVRRELDSIEQLNQHYKSSRGAVDVGEQGKLYLQNVSSNQEKIGDIKSQLSVLDQVDGYARSKSAVKGMVPSVGSVRDPALAELFTKLYSDNQQYQSLRKTTAENNPEMLALSEEIDNMRPSIMENIASQKAGLKASLENLQQTNQGYSSVLEDIPGKERNLTDINREQDVKSGIYSFLLQKKEETAISYASTASDVRVVDRAEPGALPVSPKKKVVYLSALLLALVAGFGGITARESMTRKIMFRHEIELLTDLPIIGEIAYETSGEPIVIGIGQKTFIAEQFRKLRTSLKLIGINSGKKRILVTSAMTGEGKSFVAANLATALALTGKRVVLLDGDLHNPSLDKKLHKGNAPGMTEYLTGEASLKEVLQPASPDGSLFFVSAGNLPRNPSELIMNGRIEELLNELDSAFDYIIMDTAPVIPVTDAYILSHFCDATLFVIRHKYTPKVFLERIDQDSKIQQLRNMALVFNGIQSRGFGSENYGYGYGYGYVYKSKITGDDTSGRPAGLRISLGKS